MPARSGRALPAIFTCPEPSRREVTPVGAESAQLATRTSRRPMLASALPRRPSRHLHELRREQVIPRSLEETFAFFADAWNLEAITPPWLRFRILTPPPIEMREGAIIDYRLRLWGVPIRWRTRIEAWQPPHRFVDMQIRGPYRWWWHEHTLEPHPDGTLMRDRVEYRATLDPIATPLFVRRAVERIFDHRMQAIERLLRGAQEEPRRADEPIGGAFRQGSHQTVRTPSGARG